MTALSKTLEQREFSITAEEVHAGALAELVNLGLIYLIVDKHGLAGKQPGIHSSLEAAQTATALEIPALFFLGGLQVMAKELDGDQSASFFAQVNAVRRIAIIARSPERHAYRQVLTQLPRHMVHDVLGNFHHYLNKNSSRIIAAYA